VSLWFQDRGYCLAIPISCPRSIDVYVAEVVKIP
jgi:hypothetical protein